MTELLISYTKLLIKFRYMAVAIGLFLSLTSFTAVNTDFTDYDETLWLDKSHGYTKLLHQSQKALYTYKITIPFNIDSAIEIDELKSVHNTLRRDLVSSRSLFNMPYTSLQEDTPGSSLLTLKTLENASIQTVQKRLKEFAKQYQAFYDPHTHESYFFVSSKQPFNIAHLHLPETAKVSAPLNAQNSKQNIYLLFALLLLFSLLSALIFKNIIAPLAGSLIIISTTLLSLWIYHYGLPDAFYNISLLIIASVISLLNFLYLYYRWHVNSRTMDKEKSLLYTVNRTFVPQLLNTLLIVSTLSLSLFFIENSVLRSLGFFIMIASTVSLLLSYSFGIAMLSLKTLHNPTICGITRFSALLSRLHTPSKAVDLFLFLGVSITLILFICKPLLIPSQLPQNESRVISLTLDGQLDLASVTHLHTLERNLDHSQSVTQIDSFLTKLREINHIEYENLSYTIDESAVNATHFYMQINGLLDYVYKEGKFFINIYLSHEAKTLQILKQLRALDFYDAITINDIATLIEGSKLEHFYLLWAVIAIALLLIALTVFCILKSRKHFIKVLLINTLPIMIFLFFMFSFHIPLSLEMFIAIILGIAIASDTELHQFFNLFADGKIEHDDVVPQRQESFHIAASNALVHSIILSVSILSALFFGGVVGVTAFYLSIILALNTLCDLYLIPRLNK